MVTSEVLPTLRKTGAYQAPSDPMQALRLMFEATEETKQEIKNVKDDVIDLKENQKLDAGDYNFLTRTINQRVTYPKATCDNESNNVANYSGILIQK